MIKIIEDNVHKVQVTFIYNCSIKKANEVLRKMKVPEREMIPEGECIAGTLRRDRSGRYRIVYIEDIKQVGEVIHEIFHLVVRICEDKGVTIRGNFEDGTVGDESAAYMMEFYYNKLYGRKAR